MSPLLFVVLLGLLAGLVLFVVVLGIGGAVNWLLDRIVHGSGKAKRPARADLSEQEQADLEESLEQVRRGEGRVLVAAAPANQEVFAEHPNAEVLVAAGVPVVNFDTAPVQVIEPEAPASPEPEQSIEPEEVVAVQKVKRSRLSFPKRAEQPAVEPELENQTQDETEAPAVQVAPVVVEESPQVQPEPEEVEAEPVAEPIEQARKPRRAFPRRAATEQPEAPQPQPVAEELPAVAEEPEPAAEPEEVKAESVDPFAAVFAALNKP